MIFNYGSPEFHNLRAIIYNYFGQRIGEDNSEDEFKLLAIIFYRILDKDNIDMLSKLDDMNLKFHNWSSSNDAINANLLSGQNSTLFKLYRDKKILNVDIKEVIESLFLVLYADFYEASLIATDDKIKDYFDHQATNLHHNSELLSPDSFKRLTYLWVEIPRNVFSYHLNQHLDDKVLKTVQQLQINDKFIADRLLISNSLKNNIDEIEKRLSNQRKEYNFVGLSQGFSTLREQKLRELRNQNIIYYLLMIVIILIIIGKLYWSLGYLKSSSIDEPIFIVTTISTVLFVFILLYFFRISLTNIKSIKSQILQIDLRLTLCQFIHNYDANTKDLREGMKESFERFESVIFAPIVATEEQIPSTFDGLEQLTGMINLVNKNKN